MKKHLISILLVTMAATAAPAFAAGDAAAGKNLFGTCAACHGAQAEGNKAMNAPRLTGQGETYLVRQLNNFKQGIRGADPKDMLGMQMASMAKVLADDAAVANVVAYIETLPVVASPVTVSGDAAAGKSLFAACVACHGADAKGVAAMNAPALVGQADFYLVTQLKNFKAGLRGTHTSDVFGKQMAPMAMMLPDEAAINNVVAYINSLK
jgi:cytochrome c oxidase subunit 2